MLEKDGGYVLQEGYWWNRGLVQYYFREIDNSFFLPCKTENSYVTTVSSLYSKTVYAFDDVLANPDKYLQEAATFFYYDLTAWENKRQPARSVKLLRETHVSALPEGKKSRIQVQINYSDGAKS